MPEAVRYDVGSLKRPERMPGGFLRAEGYPTRAGVLTYHMPDGSVRRELRPPDEVFKADALKGFDGVPLTNDHPSSGLLTPKNAKDFARGTVTKPTRDGDLMRAEIVVTDADTIAALEAGKRQLSTGLTCDIDETPGEWNGEKYDAVQRNIRGNHVAIVDVGRAGPEASVRMDAASAAVPPADKHEITLRVRVDASALETQPDKGKAMDEQQKRIDALTSEVGTLKAERDKAQDEAKALQAKLDTATEQVKRYEAERAQAARKALEADAAKHLPAGTKLDGDDTAIRVQVIEHLSGKKLVAAKAGDAGYVLARYDAEIERVQESAAAVGAVRTVAHLDSPSETPEQARARMIEFNRNPQKKGA